MKRSFYLALFSALLIACSVNTVSALNDVAVNKLPAPEDVRGNAEIVTLPISATSICEGSAIVIDFTASGATFDVANSFIAQLSDATGSFDTPTEIGSIVLGGDVIPENTYIFGVIPSSIPAGNGYRIRVVSTLPALTGSNNGTDITIANSFAPSVPFVSINGPTDFCFGSATTFLTSSEPNNNLWFPGGTNTNPFIGVVSSGCYYTQIQASNGCQTNSVPICINVNTPIFTFLAYFENGIIASTADTTVTICEGDSAEIGILIEGGVPPFDISYTSDGIAITTIDNVGVEIANNTYSYSFFTSQPGIFQTIGVTDNFPTNCGSNGSSGTVIVQTAPRPVTTFSYEPFCGTESGAPVAAPGFLGGGVYSFDPVPTDGAIIDPTTGVISSAVIGATYSVKYTAVGPFCEANSTVSVTVDSSDVVEFTIEPFCSGSNSLAPETESGFAGGGVYSFLTSPSDGATINSVSGIISNASPLATYNIVYVSPAGACQASDTSAVTTLESPSITGSVTDSECGQASGAIDVTISGGVAPYTITWSNTQATEDISGLTSGSYTIIVNDAQNCSVDTSFTVINSNQPELEFVVTDATCGATNGAISLTINNGVGPYEINWTPGDFTTEDLTNLAAGTYSVEVTDLGTTCEVAGSATVNFEGAPQATFVATNSLCGQSVGQIDLTVTGGTAPINHSWSNGETTEDITDLIAGSYTDTITDANGCSTIVSVNIINENQFTLTSTVVNPTCGSPNGGAIDLTINGGDSPFTFTWSPNSTNVTEDVTGLSAGEYEVIVTDDAGCIDSLTSTLQDPPVLTLTEVITDAACGQATGAIDLTVAGGSGTYNFLWSTGAETEDISGLVAGEYQVGVSDASDNSCDITQTFTIVNGNEPELVLSSTGTSCTANTGTISLEINDGSGDYTYAWTGPNGFVSAIEDLSDLAAGEYEITLTDNLTTCEITGSITVDPADAPTITSTVANTTCGQNNGLIDIEVEGGSEPFTITWNGTTNSLDRINLAPGTYDFLLVDINNCEVSQSFEILPSIAPSIELVSVNPTCGNDTGSVNVTITDATAPLLYTWTLNSAPFASVEDISNLAPGQYILVATDGAGCSVRDTANLIYENQPTLSFTSTETDCGVSNGTIDLTIDGGTAPFTISWTGPEGFASSSEDLIGLAVGCYDVTVVDNNTCEVTLQACVTNANGPEVSFDVTQPSCDLDNGAITAIVTGGEAPYTYVWEGSTETDTILNNLGEGTFVLTITDNNGCITEDSVTLNNSGLISVTADQTDATCGDNNGSISLNVTGGVAPYDYLWTPGGETASEISNLSAGEYGVTITDAVGCETTGNFTIIEAPAPEIAFTITNTLCAGTDGAIDVSVTGGSGNYTYTWTGVGISQGAQDQNGLSAGEYTVVVLDQSSGCESAETIEIINSNSFTASGVVTNTTCGNNNGSIDLTIEGAVNPLTFTWCNGQSTEDVSGLAAGICEVTISDNEGCIVNQEYEILPSLPLIANATTTGTTCGLCNGSANVTVVNGTAPFTFAWSNGSSISNPTVLCAGPASVIVSDISGCIDTVSVEIDSSSSPTIAFTQQGSTCGAASGSIDITVSNGVLPLTFAWSGPNGFTASTEDLANIEAGNYSVEVTDGNLCTVSTGIEIENTNSPVLSFVATNTTCGESTGAIDLVLENSTAPTFAWSGPNGFSATTEDIIGLEAGIYTVIVTDGLCIETGSQLITNTDGPTASLSVVNDTICNGSDVVLTFQFTGEAPFTFTYSEGILPVTVTSFDGNTYTAIVNPSTNTTYSLTSIVSDANPTCIGSIVNPSVNVVVNPNPTQPLITANGPTIFCEGGSVVLTSNSASNNVWNITGPDQLNQSITVNTSGAYSVTVLNSFGCADTSESIVVEVIPSGQITANNDTTVCAGSVLQFIATGGDNYVWSPSIYLSGTIIANPVCIPFETTTYIVTGSSTCGSGSDTIVVTVNPIVDTDLGDDITVCQNESLVLSVENVPGASYLWGPVDAIVGSNSSSSATINTSDATEVFVQTTNTNGCVFSDTVQVNITLPTATFNIVANGPTTFCEGESLVLQASTGNLVTWSNGLENFDEILVTESGSYSAVFSGGNCPAYSDTIVVTVIPSPEIEILTQGSTTICDGNCLTLNASETSNITWTSPDGSTSNNATLQACVGGWYYLSRVENSCTGIDSVLITVAPALVAPIITLDGSSILCDGQTTATLTSSYAIGNQWFLNGDPIVGETGSSIEVSEGGSYTVVVTSPEGCSATSAAQGITVKPVVPIDVTAADTVVCNGEVVNIQLSATGGFVSYLWDVTGETTSSIVAINTGIFTVTGTTEDGCVSNASIQIINNSPFELNLSSPVFFDDFNVSAQGANDGSIDLTVFGGSGAFTYDWSNGGTTSDLSGLGGGVYTVTVTDEQGCAETDSINLKEPTAIKLPNGFTPNGDGFNDFYVIKGIQGYPGNKVNIFNRWGNLVFSTQDYQNNWDGLSNDGNLLPDGTYFIVVDLNKEGTDNVENYIDLRRN